MSTPNTIAKLLADLINANNTTTSIDNNTLTVTQNGKSISIPLQTGGVVRSSISRF
jgi:hypothetical protein